MSEDLLKQAKALRSSAFGTHKQALDVVDELIAEVEWLRSDQDAIMAAWDKDAVEHDARIKALEANNKRLEAAFLESEAAMLFYRGTRYPVWPDIGAHAEVYRQKARDALEKIKAETGSGDHVAGANKLILTAAQREEEGKRDA